MKKIISLILCFTLLTFVVQLSMMSENTSDDGMTVNALSDNTAITAGNGKGTASNVFTIDAVNTYVEGANVILFYPRKFNDNLTSIPCVQNFIDANSSFPYSDYADVRVEYRSGRYTVLQKHYTAEGVTGIQASDESGSLGTGGFILLVKRGTDQYEYLHSDLIADWRSTYDTVADSSYTEDFNGDTVTLNLNSGIDFKTSVSTGDCGTISFSHLDDGIMLGESSFQIDTINPTYIEHFNQANVIAIYPYAYTKNFDNGIIDFRTVISRISCNDSSVQTVAEKIAAIKSQGWRLIRVEKRQGVYVALQKSDDIKNVADKDILDTAVQNQDGFLVLARDQTYEYNYIRDKLHVAWDSSAGTDVLSNGDLMNINEYITPSSYGGDSIMHWGTADADGVWAGVDFNGNSYSNKKLEKNGRPYAYFNFYINNVNKRDVNEGKNTDLEVADNTNIKFQIFDYGPGINNKLSTLGIADYFNFRGLGESYNSAYDDDGFTHNHASVERTLKNNFPVLNLTRRADGGTKSDTDGTLATDTYPLDENTRANLGYLFGSTLDQSKVASDGVAHEAENGTTNYITQFRVDNTLLQKNGNHYTYNSAENAVNYSGAYHKFFVRNYTERTNMTADINRTYGKQFSDFLPFSNTEGLVKGTMFSAGNDNINKHATYQMDSAVDSEQFWFGMRMDFNFVQDKNGMLNNGEKMVFNFSGDDDVWVFIDDVLVLDLGGTHGKVSGSIDFATGEVRQYIDWVSDGLKAEDSNYGQTLTEHSFPTTIYDCFEKAGKANENTWKTAASGRKIFSDYSQHTLSFFYLERGASCSNCSIDFALTTVSNDKTVEISKEAYNSDNELISEDFTTEYEFKITDINGSSLTGDERKYTIGSQEFTLGDDGILKLKNGEKARFDNWSDAGKYKIVELTKNYIQKSESSIEGTSADGEISGGTVVIVQPIDNETKYVKFKSTLDTTSLTVKKAVKNLDGSQVESVPGAVYNFGLRVYDDSTEHGKFEFSISGDQLANGYVIDNLPVGTSYQLWEYTPTDSDTSNRYGKIPMFADSTVQNTTVKGNLVASGGSPSDNDGIKGTIQANQTITVTNTLLSGSVAFDKQGDKQSVDVGTTVNYTITGKVHDTTGFTGYTYEITDRMSDGLTFNQDSLSVKIGSTDVTSACSITDKTSSGFKLSVPVGNYQKQTGETIIVTYSAVVNKNTVAKIQNNNAQLTYSNNPENNATATVSAKAAQVYSAKIVIDEYEAGKTDNKLAGAEFYMYKMDSGNKTKKYYKVDTNGAVTWVDAQSDATKMTTDNNGSASFDGIADGTYYLENVKAPDGYNLLAEPVSVTVKGKNDNDTVVEANLTVTESIENHAGKELPSTGSNGNTMTFFIGFAIVLVMALLLIAKSHTSEKD